MSLCCDEEIKAENQAILLDKYPEIAFPLSHLNIERKELSIDLKDYGHWRKKHHIDDVDILYIYGIEQGMPCLAIEPWLHEKKDRAVIVLETDLCEIEKFLYTPHAKEILLDPQVYLAYVPSSKMWSSVIDSYSFLFSSDRVHVIASESYQKIYRSKVARLRLKLLRRAALMHSCLTESLHYHLLAGNMLKNFSHIKDCSYINKLQGAFQGTPAIICGAGPSLEAAAEGLKAMEHSALIFACGSAIKALVNLGLQAHIALALDPNLDEYERLKESHAFSSFLCFSSRLNARVLDAMHPPLGYISTHTGGALESYMEDMLSLDAEPLGSDLSFEALSVTTIAVSLARAFGCSPIILCGVDLAYTGMKRYADAVAIGDVLSKGELKKNPAALEKLIVRKDRWGKTVYSLVKWVMEAKVLSSFAKSHPEIPFYRGTSEGSVIDGIAYKDLLDLKQELTSSFDIRGKLHALFQMNKVAKGKSIKEITEDLLQSVIRSKSLIEEILSEIDISIHHVEDRGFALTTPRRSVFEMDLSEEPAFCVFFSVAIHAQDKVLSRLLWSSEPEDSLEYRTTFLEKEKRKWQMVHKVSLKLIKDLSV